MTVSIPVATADEQAPPIFAFENWTVARQGGTATASWTALGTAQPFIDSTPDKLVTEDLSASWRSGSIRQLLALPGASVGGAPPATITLTFALGADHLVEWASLHRHNVRVPWKVELFRGDPTLGAPAVYSSGWLDPIVRASLRDYGSFRGLSFSLGPSERQLARWASLFRLESVMLPLSSPAYGIRWVRLSFDVSGGSNGGVDYLQASLAIVGRCLQPAVGMTLGWGIAPVDRAVVRFTESGAKRGRRKTMGRLLTFSLGYLSRDEAFKRILTDWLMQQGQLGLCFAWPEPSQRALFYDTAMLGQVSAPSSGSSGTIGGSQLSAVSMSHLEVPDVKTFNVEEAE